MSSTNGSFVNMWVVCLCLSFHMRRRGVGPMSSLTFVIFTLPFLMTSRIAISVGSTLIFEEKNVASEISLLSAKIWRVKKKSNNLIRYHYRHPTTGKSHFLHQQIWYPCHPIVYESPKKFVEIKYYKNQHMATNKTIYCTSVSCSWLVIWLFPGSPNFGPRTLASLDPIIAK